MLRGFISESAILLLEEYDDEVDAGRALEG
jgi:hypothetical protein